MTKRNTDINGYITIDGNPISKVGVFDYSGAQIGLTGEDASKIFKVYRPAEELSDPACIESFKLLPFINDHVMLGSEDNGLTPPEQKGVEGMIGESVYFEEPYLKGNIRVLSESLKNEINGGKIELSPGYRCRYEIKSGTYNGQKYDAIQRDIRGNHLALVDEGRSGADVAVLDRMTFTIDSLTLKEAIKMPETTKDEQQEASVSERIKTIIDELKPLVAEDNDLKEKILEELGIAEILDEGEEPKTPAATDESEPEKKAEDETEEKPSAALDAALKRIEALEKYTAAMDSKLLSGIADRDALASKLSDFVGTFDSSRMTVDQVAAYGVQKLGIPCAKGAEHTAVTAWLHGRTPERNKPVVGVGMDSNDADIFKDWGVK